MRYILFAAVLPFIMMGCTNSSSSSSEECDKFSDRVAIVDTDADFYSYCEVEGFSKRKFPLTPGVYPIQVEEGDMWGIGVGQDGGYIKKSDCKVETWTAEDGHGFVLPNIGLGAPKIPVRITPNDNSEVIDSLAFENSVGEPCLGREKGWLKISINKRIGYVNENEATWCLHVFGFCDWIR